MGNFRNSLDIDDVDAGVAEGFDVNGFGVFIDRSFKVRRIVRVHKGGSDAEFWQSRVKKVEGAAVKGRGSDDFVTGLGDGHDRQGDSRRARSYRQSADTAFKGGHTLFQYVRGRVHDTGVDIAVFL